jgi:hypothetical protein|nr:MAG TPA: Head fiber protein [Crassvirales sp.]
MKTIRTLVVSPDAPDTNSIWLYKGTMKYFNNGVWTTIGGDNPNIQSKVLDVNITQDQFTQILNGQSVAIRLEEADSSYDVIAVRVGNYSYFLGRTIQANGTARYATETITVEKGSPIMNQVEALVTKGIITLSANFIGLAPEIVKLEIGDSSDIKAYNLSQLKSGFFFTQLDYGYGVGTWQSSNGGFAHVTTAYGNEVFYTIGVDGAIAKDEDYIKPNEPYTIQLEASQIGKALDDITASHVLLCGEIIIDGSTGPVTYTRSVDSTASTIYFTSSKKDDTLQVLTYTVSNKTITSSIASQKYTLPAATKTTLGGIKAGTNIADLAGDADLATVIGTVNSILTQLKTAGVLI